MSLPTIRRNFLSAFVTGTFLSSLPRASAFEYSDSDFEPASAAPRIPDLQPRAIGVLEFPKLLDHYKYREILLSEDDAVTLFEQSQGNQVLRRVRSVDELEVTGYPYKTSAVVVSARANGRFRINCTSGEFGWIEASVGGPYVPYLNLLKSNLTYLWKNWDGRLYSEPSGASEVVRMKEASRSQFFENTVPVELRDHSHDGYQLWVETLIFQESVCEVRDPKRLGVGWIPLYARDGTPVVDFYSGGC